MAAGDRATAQVELAARRDGRRDEGATTVLLLPREDLSSCHGDISTVDGGFVARWGRDAHVPEQ